MRHVCIALLLFSNLMTAQNLTFEKDINKLIELNGATASLEAIKDEMIKNVDESKKQSFIKDFDALTPLYVKGLAEIYKKEYTHKEVKSLIAFFESDLGKKMVRVNRILYPSEEQGGNEWGLKFNELLMKYTMDLYED